MDVLEDDYASSRIVGDSHSSIVDLPLMQVMGDKLVSVAAWYDNEWGFTTRLAETAAMMVSESRPSPRSNSLSPLKKRGRDQHDRGLVFCFVSTLNS